MSQRSSLGSIVKGLLGLDQDVGQLVLGLGADAVQPGLDLDVDGRPHADLVASAAVFRLIAGEADAELLDVGDGGLFFLGLKNGGDDGGNQDGPDGYSHRDPIR
jgi:hypothetical protein